MYKEPECLCIVTRSQAGCLRSRSFTLCRTNNTASLQNVKTSSGAYQASYLLDSGALSREVKRPGREADNPTPSSADGVVMPQITFTLSETVQE